MTAALLKLRQAVDRWLEYPNQETEDAGDYEAAIKHSAERWHAEARRRQAAEEALAALVALAEMTGQLDARDRKLPDVDARVDDYQRRLDSEREHVSYLTAELATSQKEVTAMHAVCRSKQSSINKLEPEVATLRAELEQTKGERTELVRWLKARSDSTSMQPHDRNAADDALNKLGALEDLRSAAAPAQPDPCGAGRCVLPRIGASDFCAYHQPETETALPSPSPVDPRLAEALANPPGPRHGRLIEQGPVTHPICSVCRSISSLPKFDYATKSWRCVAHTGWHGFACLRQVGAVGPGPSLGPAEPQQAPEAKGSAHIIDTFSHELGCTIRDCLDCGCLVPGGPTRCKRCANADRLFNAQLATVARRALERVEATDDSYYALRFLAEAAEGSSK